MVEEFTAVTPPVNEWCGGDPAAVFPRARSPALQNKPDQTICGLGRSVSSECRLDCDFRSQTGLTRRCPRSRARISEIRFHTPKASVYFQRIHCEFRGLKCFK